MFILTKEKSIRLKNIIGVFDLDTSTVSGTTKNFLMSAEKSNKITGTNILPKSFVFTDDRIYLSLNMTGKIKNSVFQHVNAPVVDKQ